MQRQVSPASRLIIAPLFWRTRRGKLPAADLTKSPAHCQAPALQYPVRYRPRRQAFTPTFVTGFIPRRANVAYLKKLQEREDDRKKQLDTVPLFRGTQERGCAMKPSWALMGIGKPGAGRQERAQAALEWTKASACR